MWRRRRVVLAVPTTLIALAPMTVLAVAAGPSSSASARAGCQGLRPAVAHHANQQVLARQPRSRPAVCGRSTGWPAVENRIEVTNNNTVLYEPALQGGPVASGDGHVPGCCVAVVGVAGVGVRIAALAAGVAALPLLRAAEWARIVNVSAHSTKRQGESLVAYTAAKSMLTSITKNLSLSLAKDEILVNTVSPGTFATEGLSTWARSIGVEPTDLRAVMSAIAEHFGHPAQLGRAGNAAEIGAVIAFAASRRNSYMTGADINVDGGSDFT